MGANLLVAIFYTVPAYPHKGWRRSLFGAVVLQASHRIQSAMRICFGSPTLSLHFLKELSHYDGDTYINNPVEVGWLVTLKNKGLVDADIGPSALTQYPNRPPIYAIARGLTAKGYAALGQRPRRRHTFWSLIFGLNRRRFPRLRFRNHETAALPK